MSAEIVVIVIGSEAVAPFMPLTVNVVGARGVADQLDRRVSLPTRTLASPRSRRRRLKSALLT